MDERPPGHQYWGEILKADLKADIADVAKDVAAVAAQVKLIGSTTVTHRELMVWAAGFSVTIIGACLYMGNLSTKGLQATIERVEKGTQVAVERVEAMGLENQKDNRALYKAMDARSDRRQRRLEAPPVTPPPSSTTGSSR